MAEPAARAGDDDPLPGFDVAAFESGVCGNAGAQHGCGFGGGEGLGNRGDVAGSSARALRRGRGGILGRADNVLLEGTGMVVPAYGLVEADAVAAFETRHCEGFVSERTQGWI